MKKASSNKRHTISKRRLITRSITKSASIRLKRLKGSQKCFFLLILNKFTTTLPGVAKCVLVNRNDNYSFSWRNILQYRPDEVLLIFSSIYLFIFANYISRVEHSFMTYSRSYISHALTQVTVQISGPRLRAGPLFLDVTIFGLRGQTCVSWIALAFRMTRSKRRWTWAQPATNAKGMRDTAKTP